MTAAYVASIMRNLPAVRKSAGTSELLAVVCGPLCEQIVVRDKAAEKTARQTAKRTRQMKRIHRTLKAIAGPQDSGWYAAKTRIVPVDPPEPGRPLEGNSYGQAN